MNAPLYTTEILRLAAALSDPQPLEREDGRAELRSPTCGSRIETAVQLDNGRITALSQQVRACAFGQSSAALLERGAIGQSREDIEEVLSRLSDWLAGGEEEPGWGLSVLAPARSRRSRHGAILLPFRTLLAAIQDSADR